MKRKLWLHPWVVGLRIALYFGLGVYGWFALKSMLPEPKASPARRPRDSYLGNARPLVPSPATEHVDESDSTHEVPTPDRPVLYTQKPLRPEARDAMPLEVKSKSDVGFRPHQGGQWQESTIEVKTQTRLASIDGASISLSGSEQLNQVAAVYGFPGHALILSAGGILHYAESSGTWAWSPQLHAGLVRPQSGAPDARGPSLWLFGESAYRVDCRERLIEEWASPRNPFSMAHWMTVDRDRVWLGTDQDIRRWSPSSGREERLVLKGAGGRTAWVTGSLSGEDAWFLSERGTILHVPPEAPPEFEVSEPISLGRPTALAVEGPNLWMLMSEGGGLKSRLAVLSGRTGDALRELTIFEGDVFILRKAGDILLGGGTVDLFAIHSPSRATTPLNASVAISPDGVIFGGSTYEYSYSTYFVARHILDLSKGWENAYLNEWQVLNPMYAQNMALASQPKMDLRGVADSGPHLWFWFPQAVWRLNKSTGELTLVRVMRASDPEGPLQISFDPVIVGRSEEGEGE